MTDRQTNEKRLRALLDLISEDTMAWSDDEVRSRAAKEGFDLAANLRAFRTRLAESEGDSRSARLKRSRQLLDRRIQEPGNSGLAGASKEQLRERLNALIAAQGQSRYGMTLRHREGKEMSEDDLRSLIEDYEELEQLDPTKREPDKR